MSLSDIANVASNAFTAASVILLTGGSSVPIYFGIIITSGGAVSTTLSFAFEDLNVQKFNRTLYTALISNPLGWYNVSFEYANKLFNRADICRWDCWNSCYLYKYENISSFDKTQRTRVNVLNKEIDMTVDYHDIIK